MNTMKPEEAEYMHHLEDGLQHAVLTVYHDALQLRDYLRVVERLHGRRKIHFGQGDNSQHCLARFQVRN